MKKSVTKILAVLMAVMMLLSSVAITVSAQASPTVVISDATGKAGETVDVTISLENNPGIVNMLLNLSYDHDALELTKVSDAGNLGTKYHSNNLTAKPYRLNWADDVGETNMTFSGLLVTLTFTVKETAAAGKYDITVTYEEGSDIYDVYMNPVNFTVVNGSITVEDTEPTVVISDATGKAGETVDVTISLENNPGIVNMLLNLSYDYDALELTKVSDAGNLGTKYHTNNLTAKPYKLNWADDVGETNMTFSGLLVTLTFTVKETAAAGKYDITVTYEEGSDIYDVYMNPVNFTVVNGSVTVDAEPAFVIDDNITVFEMSILHTDAESIIKDLLTVGKGDVTNPLLAVNKDTGIIYVFVVDGYVELYAKDGTALTLNNTTATDVTVIYNDTNCTVRCYVNDSIAYFMSGETPIMIDGLIVSDFSLPDATGSETVTVGEGVTLKSVYNIGDSGTSEVVAFQEHNEENAIRILAGVDMPWYGAIGFELEVYKDGVGQGVEVRTSQLIYESILSNGETVDASEYGHNFFAACTIDGVDVSDGSTYYINVKPFTQVGETIYRGTLAKINIDANGDYSFAE